MIIDILSTKVKGRLGPGPKYSKIMRVLNRVVEWTDNSIIYEAEQRHDEILCNELGYKADSKGVVTPGMKPQGDPEEDETLSEEDSSRFRALAARANYLAQDIPDIQHATKELCREMSNPTARSWNGLKRLGRYLVDHPRLVQEFRRQGRHDKFIAWSDTDYAGCPMTRKSTSGGVMTIGSHVIKSWS